MRYVFKIYWRVDFEPEDESDSVCDLWSKMYSNHLLVSLLMGFGLEDTFMFV